jgi:hypothetical protein
MMDFMFLQIRSQINKSPTVSWKILQYLKSLNWINRYFWFEKMLKGTSPGGGVFETLIGRDEKLVKEDYDNGGWWGHNTNRYGTKWDIDFNEHQFDFTNGCLLINCETAWSPPTEFVENLSIIDGLMNEGPMLRAHFLPR